MEVLSSMGIYSKLKHNLDNNPNENYEIMSNIIQNAKQNISHLALSDITSIDIKEISGLRTVLYILLKQGIKCTLS